MDTTEHLKELLSDTDGLIGLANDGLLKSERLHGDKQDIERCLTEIGKELDERSQLSIEKVIPKWHNQPKSGVLISKEAALKELVPLFSLLQELISKISNTDNEIKSKEENKQKALKIFSEEWNQAMSILGL